MHEGLNLPEKLTDDEIEYLASQLKRLPRGYLPKPVFEAIAGLVTTSIVEVVPVRRDATGRTEILLTRRPPDDPIWPNMLHAPGAVVLATDASPDNSEALGRILKGELEGTQTSQPTHAFDIKHDSERGAEQSRVFWAEVTGTPAAGEFYPADDLPDDLVPSQLDFIPLAVQNYETTLAAS